MNTERPNNKIRGKDSTGGVGPHYCSDPIARNPKDVDKPEETIKTMEVSRSNSMSVLAAIMESVSFALNFALTYPSISRTHGNVGRIYRL